MKIKTLEVSLSKEERRITDEHGNTASTWARIGFTIEMEDGDLSDKCIQQLKGEIQPEVDAWLLNQGGYIFPPGQEIAEVEEDFAEMIGSPKVKISEVLDDDAGDDEIPL